MDAFVHASGDGFGNTAPLRSDTGAIDMDAISQVAHVTQGAGKLTRKEKKHAKREMKRRKKEAKKAEKEAKKTYSSIKSQLKDRDKELSDKMADARKKRDSAKDVVNYIGYNKMYQDGICEVEEGMFSSSIAFDDTSYHSVRDEQQKAMFSAITRLYDQFGADTLVQMSVINTPLLKEEVGHRKFFDPERQANDAARNDAQVFNNILNDKVKEGVSNIRRNRYLTYSVTADTAEDAARQLSRIEVESSRILNSIGSKAHLMNGTQRLSVVHSLLNPYKPFLFDYQRDISAKRLQTTKDCIAPTQIDFRPDGHYNDCVKLDNGVYAQVLVMKKFGSELSDRALADMADLPIPMAITWYVQPMDKSKAINYVRTRSAWIDKEIIEEQRSAVNKGYDFSILPQELKYSKEETEDVLDHLQNLPPTLQDFYDAANEQPEEQAQVIALRYERFVKGSMNFFNHQSNVDFNTRIVDFNLKDLPDSMLVFALINVCEAVRNRMYFNAKRNVRTWLYVEEMQSMFAYPTVLNYFSRFSNEGRKFGLLLTGISQNATAMLANEAARNIVLNADFLMLLKQSPFDRMKWAELLNLSEQEEECIDESAEPGDGLLIAGNARVPIRGKFPSGNVLYDLFSTNPNETKKTGLGDKKDAKPVI